MKSKISQIAILACTVILLAVVLASCSTQRMGCPGAITRESTEAAGNS